MLQFGHSRRTARKLQWVYHFLAITTCIVLVAPTISAWQSFVSCSSSWKFGRALGRSTRTPERKASIATKQVWRSSALTSRRSMPGDFQDSFAADWPSVSVQMVTYERPTLLLEALQQVALQEYPGSVEAVIVDDSAQSSKTLFEQAAQQGLPLPEINYIYLTERMSIGAKRNLAARSTSADVLCVWDDDDVFTKDRLKRQVQHLQSSASADGSADKSNGRTASSSLSSAPVHCSGIEVASIFSVPRDALSTRPRPLPMLVFENSLCFTRSWWEANGCGFGESWEVSGQGEGTLEPWWEEVRPLAGKDLPFIYAQLKSSASGGTALVLDPHPPPDEAMHALVQALGIGRFPDEIQSPHVRTMLDGTRRSLQEMLADQNLFDTNRLQEVRDFEAFARRYEPVREKYRMAARP